MTAQEILEWIAETPPDCLLILLFGTLWFIIYYVIQYRQWGTVSLGTWIIGFDFYLKTIFMYMFARSPENMVAVGRHFPAILANLDRALRISAVGILSMLFGALAVAPSLASRRLPKMLDGLHQILLKGWCNRRGMIIALSLALGSTVLLYALGFQLFAARSLTFERPALRPIYNIWTDLLPLCALAVTAYGINIGSRLTIVGGVAVALLGALSGDRTVIILTLVQLWIIGAMPARRKNLIVPLAGVIVLLLAAVGLNTLRTEGQAAGTARLGILADVLYGSNLSDLRDFAWVLSGLFDERYHGLTYLAGYISFVPAFLSDFRYDLAVGRVTALIAGVDPSKHAGMRLPMLGEAYLNFDWPGVIIGGIVYGIALRTILDWVETTIRSQTVADQGTGAVAVWTGCICHFILTSIFFTPGFPGAYLACAFVVAGTMLRRFARRPPAIA
jgi:oligosaccharide repeat unit polymerase